MRAGSWPGQAVTPPPADAAGPIPPRGRILLLGPVRVWDAAGCELRLPTRKARALLGYLLMAGGRPVSRVRLAALLWERAGEAEARASLRQATLELSRGFGDPPVILTDRESLRADPRGWQVDALELLAAGGAAPQDAPPLMDGLEAIGEAFGEWLAAERDAILARLRALREAELEALQADPSAPVEAAIEAARRLVALDASHEPGWRALMQLLARAGNRAQALAEYERCRAALRRALDVEPAPETRELAARLRAPLARPAPALALPPPGRSPGQPPGQPPGQSARQEADRRLRVGVLAAPDPGGGEPNPVASAYAHEVALELVRYRHFDVLDPDGLAGVQPRSPDSLRAFGLDYLVGVAIRRVGEGSQLLLSLLDVSELTRPVWSDREPLDPEAGGVETEVLARLVARLEPVILHAEGTRMPPRHATDASKIVVRAIPLLFSMEGARFRRAGEMLAEAVTREPENAMAATWAAQWHVFQIGQGWASDPDAALEEAERLAVLAMSLDPESAEAAAIYGHVSSFLHKDFDSAAHYLARALELNPHQASVWAYSAATEAYSGNTAEALRRLERYRTLAPRHPHDRIFGQIYTAAYTIGGEFEKALTFGRRAVRAAPGYTNGYKPVLAALGHLGMQREARPVLAALLKLDPGFNVPGFVRSYPFRRPEDREAYAEGLRLAGAPKD
jgi:DNA-binding SARP family transcriptional activator